MVGSVSTTSPPRARSGLEARWFGLDGLKCYSAQGLGYEYSGFRFEGVDIQGILQICRVRSAYFKFLGVHEHSIPEINLGGSHDKPKSTAHRPGCKTERIWPVNRHAAALSIACFKLSACLQPPSTLFCLRVQSMVNPAPESEFQRAELSFKTETEHPPACSPKLTRNPEASNTLTDNWSVCPSP